MVQCRINKVLYIWFFLIAFFVGMTTIAGEASWVAGVVFFVFQNMFILIPGTGILAGLEIKVSSKLEFVSLGYAIGFAFNIITYYLIMLTGIKAYSVWVLCCEALVAIVVLYKSKNEWITLAEDAEGNFVCGIMLCILFLCKFITYFSVNKIPSYGEANFYTADLMYYIGNSVEMVKEFPTKDFRWYTQPFKYNLFGNAQMALLQMVMRIPMTVLEFSYGFIQPCILLVLSMYTLFKRLGLQTKFCALGLASAFLASGWESGTFCTYAAHIYIVPFGFDISIAYMMLSILFYILYIQEKRINGKILMLLSFFLMTCTGSKAPIAVILIAAFGIECAYRFLIKRSYKLTVAVGLSLLSAFLLIFFGVTSEGFSTLNGNGNSLTLQPLRNVLNSRVGSSIVSLLPSVLPSIVKYLIAVIIYIALSIPGLGILSVLILKYRKTISPHVLEKNIIFINIIFVGIIFGLIMNQNGYSQMYFLFAVIPSVTVLLMKALSKIYGKRNRCTVVAVTILIVMLCLFQFYQYKHYYKTGITNLVWGIEGGWSEEQANLVTYGEYEAYEWIRNNTGEDSLLASNVILQTNQGRSFVTGAFSERHLWLEGWEYGYVVRSEEEVLHQKDLMTRAMGNDLEAVDELINDGVDYLIQIKRVSPGFVLDMRYGQPVFENDSVCIYSINGNILRRESL